MRPLKTDSQIDKILQVGYAESNVSLLYKLRRRGIDWRSFGFSHRSGSTKFDSIDYFGKPYRFYFIVGMEEHLINHLLYIFTLHNPYASKSLKGAFNHMLRDNYLIGNKRCVFHQKL